MENIITILDSRRQKVGDAKASLCCCLHELTENFVIHKFMGGLPYYESQFPYKDYWPIFVFSDIWIESCHRKTENKNGSRAFNEIADYYQELGARLGLLRMGTQGDDLEEGIAWRTRMYGKLGWITLRHHPDEQSIIPLMYLPMKKRKLTSIASARLIQVADSGVLDSPLVVRPITSKNETYICV